MSIESKINSLITAANTKTGKTDANLTSAVQSLVDGYGMGSKTPPAVAVAQFSIAVSIAGNVGSLTLDFSGLQTYMSAKKTYAWSLILWRSSQITGTTARYVVNQFCIQGRLSVGNVIDVNDCRMARTSLNSMTAPHQLNVVDFKKGKTISDKFATIVSSITDTEWAGDYIGVFTLLPPYTDAYTGDKLTDCPDGFLTFATAAEESPQSNELAPEDSLSIITGGVV